MKTHTPNNGCRVCDGWNCTKENPHTHAATAPVDLAARRFKAGDLVWYRYPGYERAGVVLWAHDDVGGCAPSMRVHFKGFTQGFLQSDPTIEVRAE